MRSITAYKYVRITKNPILYILLMLTTNFVYPNENPCIVSSQLLIDSSSLEGKFVLSLDNSQKLSGIQCSLQFAPSILQPTTLEKGERTADFDISFHHENGKAVILVYSFAGHLIDLGRGEFFLYRLKLEKKTM